MYNNDNRIVMTLDAGGTNFVFLQFKVIKRLLFRCVSRLQLMIWHYVLTH